PAVRIQGIGNAFEFVGVQPGMPRIFAEQLDRLGDLLEQPGRAPALASFFAAFPNDLRRGRLQLGKRLARGLGHANDESHGGAYSSPAAWCTAARSMSTSLPASTSSSPCWTSDGAWRFRQNHSSDSGTAAALVMRSPPSTSSMMTIFPAYSAGSV